MKRGRFHIKQTVTVGLMLVMTSGLYGRTRYLSEIFEDCPLTVNECTYKTVENRILSIAVKQDLQVTVYRPACDTLNRRPLLIWLHSGGFVTGDIRDREIVRLCEDFARRGFVTASVAYRLYTFGDAVNLWRLIYKAVQDVNDATGYILNNENLYGISSDHVYVGGFSAGAITALHCGFLHRDNQYGFSNQSLPDIYGQISGFINVPYKGIISIAGGMPDNEIISNRHRISVLSFHGDRDILVNTLYGTPVYEIENVDVVSIYNRVTGFLGNIADDISEEFFKNIALKDAIIPPLHGSLSTHRKFDALGIDNTLHLFEGYGHSLFKNIDIESGIYDTIVNRTAVFLYNRLKPDAPESLLNYSPSETANATVNYEAPAGFRDYVWIVENGKPTDENKNSVRIRWSSKGRGILKLLVANEIGLYSDTAVFEVKIDERQQKRHRTQGKRNPLIFVVAGLVLISAIYVVYIKSKQ
jgi:predicted esterase